MGLGDKQAILDQYADILRLRNRLASAAPEGQAWTRRAGCAQPVHLRLCRWDAHSDELIRTHSNAGDNSGGEREKLMAFCLAGALELQPGIALKSGDNKPVFAQLMLDEAFSKSDPQFAQQWRCRRSASSASSSSSRGQWCSERDHHPALHRFGGDGVEAGGHRPRRLDPWPPWRLQDDLRLRRAAARDGAAGRVPYGGEPTPDSLVINRAYVPVA